MRENRVLHIRNSGCYLICCYVIVFFFYKIDSNNNNPLGNKYARTFTTMRRNLFTAYVDVFLLVNYYFLLLIFTRKTCLEKSQVNPKRWRVGPRWPIFQTIIISKSFPLLSKNSDFFWIVRWITIFLKKVFSFATFSIDDSRSCITC